jgi:hypothetical protein
LLVLGLCEQPQEQEQKWKQGFQPWVLGLAQTHTASEQHMEVVPLHLLHRMPFDACPSKPVLPRGASDDVAPLALPLLWTLIRFLLQDGGLHIYYLHLGVVFDVHAPKPDLLPEAFDDL